MVLGPTKTQRTAGVQSLSPTVIGLLSTRRKIQDDDRAKLGEPGQEWTTRVSNSASTTRRDDDPRVEQ